MKLSMHSLQNKQTEKIAAASESKSMLISRQI